MAAIQPYRAGFVGVVGLPNAGKSTLINTLLGRVLCSVTQKAQTTRHEIMGVFTTSTFQLVFCDTPGWLAPHYPLHDFMLANTKKALAGSDVVLVLTDISSKAPEGDTTAKMARVLEALHQPIIRVISKVDLLKPYPAPEREALLAAHRAAWSVHLTRGAWINISSLRGDGLDGLLHAILPHIPEHPAYFPAGQLSNKDPRFFVSDRVIRAIFLHFRKEIPYSVCARVTDFEEANDCVTLAVMIYTERASQKGILLGKNGRAIKRIRLQATKDLARFFGKSVRLRLQISVLKDWRHDRAKLQELGF